MSACACMDTVDQRLAEAGANTQLSRSFYLGDSVSSTVTIATNAVEKKRGQSPWSVKPTFCPFCGVKLDAEAASADGLATADADEFESAGLPHAAGSILAGISPFGKGAYIAAVASALTATASGCAFARRLIKSGAENYIGEVFDTERGDIEVIARYVSGLTPADKLAQLEAACALEADVFGWWMEDANGVCYFSRKMQPAALYAYRTTPGYSATALYAGTTLEAT